MAQSGPDRESKKTLEIGGGNGYGLVGPAGAEDGMGMPEVREDLRNWLIHAV